MERLKVLLLDARAEPSPTKPVFRFRKKIRSLDSFMLNRLVRYRILMVYRFFHKKTTKVSYFLRKPIFGLRSLKNGLIGEGSAHVSRRKTFKAFVELKNLFLSISSHLDAISKPLNLFWEFRIELIFFRVIQLILVQCFRKYSVCSCHRR